MVRAAPNAGAPCAHRRAPRVARRVGSVVPRDVPGADGGARAFPSGMTHPTPTRSRPTPVLADAVRLAELDATRLLHAPLGAQPTSTPDAAGGAAARRSHALVTLVDAERQHFVARRRARPWRPNVDAALAFDLPACRHQRRLAPRRGSPEHPELRDSLAFPERASSPTPHAAAHHQRPGARQPLRHRRTAARWSADDVAHARGAARAATAEIERPHRHAAPRDHAGALARQSRDVAVLLDGAARSQATLRGSAAEYRALLASLPVIVYRVEPHAPYRPLYVSPGGRRAGYTLDEWMATPDMWLAHAAPRRPGPRPRRHRRGAERGRGGRLRVPRPGEGREPPLIHDRGAFVHDADGAPVAWQGVMLDVTAQRVAETRCARARRASAPCSTARRSACRWWTTPASCCR
jgi:PAS domain-containing protein